MVFAGAAREHTLAFGLLLLSYRTGTYLCIIFLPVALSPLIPKAGPLSLTNVLLLGTLLSFGVNWILARMSKKDIVVPIPREFVLYYLLPIAIAAMIGSFHLGEIPRAFLESRNFAAYGLKEYWISLYFKEHLIIAMAFVFAAAVVVRGSWSWLCHCHAGFRAFVCHGDLLSNCPVRCKFGCIAP